MDKSVEVVDGKEVANLHGGQRVRKRTKWKELDRHRSCDRFLRERRGARAVYDLIVYQTVTIEYGGLDSGGLEEGCLSSAASELRHNVNGPGTR